MVRANTTNLKHRQSRSSIFPVIGCDSPISRRGNLWSGNHSLNPELQKIVNERLQELGRKREAISVAEANALNESNCHMAYEPQIRRAKAKSYVAWCNNVVHEAPWTKGERRSLGGINIVLELAELAHRAHGLRYESGISRMSEFPPRRFRWVYSEGGETDDCVLVLDLQTQCLAVWPHWLG